MKQYTVLKYNNFLGCHECLDENGRHCRVDLMVHGSLPEDTNPEALVGRTFEADYDFPHISLAVNVREKKENPQ